MVPNVVSPPTPEGEVPPGKANPKVPPKGPKEKKEAEAKKGKQPAVLEEPSSAGGESVIPVMGGGEGVMGGGEGETGGGEGVMGGGEVVMGGGEGVGRWGGCWEVGRV